MSIERFYVDDVERVRPAWTEDRYGNVVPDWDNATTETIKGWLASVTTTETTGGREAITTERELSLPADSDVETTDRFEADGGTWQIIGEPYRAKRPIGGPHHLVVLLKKVEG